MLGERITTVPKVIYNEKADFVYGAEIYAALLKMHQFRVICYNQITALKFHSLSLSRSKSTTMFPGASNSFNLAQIHGPSESQGQKSQHLKEHTIRDYTSRV